MMELRRGRSNGWVLFIPHFAFHAFNDDYGEKTADEHCIELLSVSDMLCICLDRNESLTNGMKKELDYAKRHNMPVMYLNDFMKDPYKTLKENLPKKYIQAITQ